MLPLQIPLVVLGSIRRPVPRARIAICKERHFPYDCATNVNHVVLDRSQNSSKPRQQRPNVVKQIHYFALASYHY